MNYRMLSVIFRIVEYECDKKHPANTLCSLEKSSFFVSLDFYLYFSRDSTHLP